MPNDPQLPLPPERGFPDVPGDAVVPPDFAPTPAAEAEQLGAQLSLGCTCEDEPELRVVEVGAGVFMWGAVHEPDCVLARWVDATVERLSDDPHAAA